LLKIILNIIGFMVLIIINQQHHHLQF